MHVVENNTHDGNYQGTKNTHADNQDMEFVHDTLQVGKDKKGFKSQKQGKRLQ
jgi:hypothetical protein